MIKFSDLEGITGGRAIQIFKDRIIKNLLTDSRKVGAVEGTIFFALAGERHDGHQFLRVLYTAGIRQFVIEREMNVTDYPEGNFLLVASSLAGLHALVSHHRKSLSAPVVGITGSNGKTIIKEWLYQLLSSDFHIAKNPGSYNSQLGVPLSVWAMQSYHTLGIFEAGISRPGEMARLEKIIQPTIGIFTNLGPAHDEGFNSIEEKLNEKLQLFNGSSLIIYCKDHKQVAESLEGSFKGRLMSWGRTATADVRIIPMPADRLAVFWKGNEFVFRIPFSDRASVENVCHCIVMMLHLGCAPDLIGERVLELRTVPMRLELKQGINQCQIIDDTYNNDLSGLQISLDFLAGMKKEKNTLILSDILQSGLTDMVLVNRICELLSKSAISNFIGIGPGLTAHQQHLRNILTSQFYSSTREFLDEINWNQFQNETILVKGARSFQFEHIVRHLQKKIHGTVMEIDLGALVHNLNFFKAKLNPGVKRMVMVKAFAYGSGSEEVTNLLQYHQVDYLGVAYPDEGVELRRHHIHLPIMVMNPSQDSYSTLLENSLEPEIYSLSMLESISAFLNGRRCVVHIKLDTGMHRLGLEEADVTLAINILRAHPNIHVGSIFSHLAGADESAHDAFTREQAERFLSMSQGMMRALEITPLLHLLNSSGIIRFPDFQLDMVRLGIGLFGVNPTEERVDQLKPVATLKTVISQIKKVKVGESIGYGRKGVAKRETTIATIAIGYADGFSRRFSNGKGVVSIHGTLVPVIGNVCMDMTMVDITGVDAKEGDEVIIFGRDLPIQKIATRIDTIPYEILTSTNERVKRVFYTESI